MNKQEFRLLFLKALECAALNADRKIGHQVSRNFQIRVHGAGHQGDLLGPEEVLDILYLGVNRFYRIIDLSITEVSKTASTVFLRVSDHTPGPIDQTWNQPPGSGPFKQLLAEKISVKAD
jgi:hypothetical protein